MIALRQSSEPAFVFRQAELRIQDSAARKVALDFKVLDELMTVGRKYERHGVQVADPVAFALLQSMLGRLFLALGFDDG